MFDKFIKEKWIYIPYERNDKRKLNYKVPERLEKKLNCRGIITEMVPNKIREIELNRAKARSQTSITNNNFSIADALIYSNGSPIFLNLFENTDVWPPSLVDGHSFDENFIGLYLNYFSSADEKDLKFIYKCLKETRFKQKN